MCQCRVNNASLCCSPHVQVHLFAHLTLAKVVSPESMIGLLESFTAVLDEFGVSQSRAKRAAICAGEGLIIVSSKIVILEAMAHHTFSLGMY